MIGIFLENDLAGMAYNLIEIEIVILLTDHCLHELISFSSHTNIGSKKGDFHLICEEIKAQTGGSWLLIIQL
jgi:hypothetical protein